MYDPRLTSNDPRLAEQDLRLASRGYRVWLAESAGLVALGSTGTQSALDQQRSALDSARLTLVILKPSVRFSCSALDSPRPALDSSRSCARLTVICARLFQSDARFFQRNVQLLPRDVRPETTWARIGRLYCQRCTSDAQARPGERRSMPSKALDDRKLRRCCHPMLVRPEQSKLRVCRRGPSYVIATPELARLGPGSTNSGTGLALGCTFTC